MVFKKKEEKKVTHVKKSEQEHLKATDATWSEGIYA